MGRASTGATATDDVVERLHEGEPAPEIGPWRPSWHGCVAALVIVAGSLAGSFVVRGIIQSEQQRDLERRSAEVSQVLSARLTQVTTALEVVASIAAVESAEPSFVTATEALVRSTDAEVAIGRARPNEDAGFLVTVVRGDLDVALGRDEVALLRRALVSDDVVGARVDDGGAPRLMYAIAASDGSVVFRTVEIDPETAQPTLAGQVVDDLDVSVFASPSADPGQLVRTNVVPAVQAGESITLRVGADEWLLVTSPRAALRNGVAQRAPIAVLLVGVIAALIVFALVEAIAQRRRWAMRLVDLRTADLRAALVEREELAQGQRTARDEAERANHAKNEFLSRMSHELRTPLNGVLGFAQVLEMDDLTEHQHEAINQILKGGWHLLDLINEVLDITRIESGNMQLSSEPVYVPDVIQECVALIRPIATERRVQIVESLGSCEQHVFADRQRCKQVILNLLSNAIKYNRLGGTVVIRCSPGDDELALHVIDTGPGIRPEQLELLFTPFERLGADRTDVEGTGIGLALSLRLAQAMHGRLEVDSEVGRGSTFTLTLPLAEGPVERFARIGRAGPERAGGDARHTVLYIEDNTANLRLIERLLEPRTDVELVVAMQGRLGLELCRQHRPTVVLLDLHLPDIDGAELLRQICDDPDTSRIPVVVISADATVGQVGRLHAAGAYAYLTKPIDVPQLLATLDRIFAEHGAAPPPIG